MVYPWALIPQCDPCAGSGGSPGSKCRWFHTPSKLPPYGHSLPPYIFCAPAPPLWSLNEASPSPQALHDACWNHTSELGPPEGGAPDCCRVNECDMCPGIPILQGSQGRQVLLCSSPFLSLILPSPAPALVLGRDLAEYNRARG